MLEHIWPYKEHMYASDKQPCSILSIKAANESKRGVLRHFYSAW